MNLMSLWAKFRNHDYLYELEKEIQRLQTEVQRLNKALNVANFEAASWADRFEKQSKTVHDLNEKLQVQASEKIKVIEEIRSNISGATVSRGSEPVPEEHVSIKDLSKALEQSSHD